MSRKRIVSPFSHLYYREQSITIDGGRVIQKGEVIKIKGINATKFVFKEHVRRTDSGIEWIDCFELDKGVSCGQRSFRTDRIKPLPKAKKKRNKI